jgi:ABC-type Mn2+/Zn2+ transport system ATPase subunit
MTELTYAPTTIEESSLPTDQAPKAPVGGRVDAVNVSRQVGARHILQELSLSIEPGELVAIAGGSGAGKTTLLEILAGLQPPSAGKVRHDGFVLGARFGAESRIGYVPQDDIIHLEMPLRRTLRYAARLRLPAGTPAAEADRVVEETMRDLDLADRAEVPVRALSGGQRKRASIAVELLTRPHLFFLDEPTSGLDPSTAADVMRLLRRLSERGVTVVLTTHEPEATSPSPEARPRLGGTSGWKISPRCTTGWLARTPLRSGRSDSRTASGNRKLNLVRVCRPSRLPVQTSSAPA